MRQVAACPLAPRRSRAPLASAAQGRASHRTPLESCRMDLLRSVCFPLVLAAVLRPAIGADVPRVHFDMPLTIAWRDVTPPEFAAANPNHKLAEAVFKIATISLSR